MQKGRILPYLQRKQALLTVFTFLLVTFLLLQLLFQATLDKKNHTQNFTKQAYAKSKPTATTTPSVSPVKPSETKSKTKTLKPTIKPEAIQNEPTIQPHTSPTDFILLKVNEYRQTLGLSSVSPNSETCEFAKIRAEEIASLNTFNHDGFSKRVSEKTLPYTSYTEITENIAYNTDYADVVNKWIASPGHAENMQKNTSYVCIGKFGDYYTYEGLQP